MYNHILNLIFKPIDGNTELLEVECNIKSENIVLTKDEILNVVLNSINRRIQTHQFVKIKEKKIGDIVINKIQ